MSKLFSDFWQTNSSMINKNHFRPIKDVNDNHATASPSNSFNQDTASTDYEQQHQRSLTIK